VGNNKNPNEKRPGEKEPGTFRFNPGNMSGKTKGDSKNDKPDRVGAEKGAPPSPVTRQK
jgi:hypothetical protein